MWLHVVASATGLEHGNPARGMHFLKPGLGGHAPGQVSVLRENQPGSKRQKTKVNFIYRRRKSETGERRGSLSCLPCPRCVGIGPGLLPWLCGAPQASGSAQLPWPGPALLPCLCGLLRCPGLPSSPGLARPCRPALPVCGLLRRPGLPSSPGPALCSCPACVRAPQVPRSAQLPWPGPSVLPVRAPQAPGSAQLPWPALPRRAHCLPSGTLSPFCLRVFDVLQYNFSF